MTAGRRTGLKTRNYKEPGSSPASTKTPTKAPSVADAELDGVMALAARDRENSRARGQVYLKTPNVKSKLLGYDLTG
jgi:hypothetical protein